MQDSRAAVGCLDPVRVGAGLQCTADVGFSLQEEGVSLQIQLHTFGLYGNLYGLFF